MSIHWGGRGAGHVSRWSASTTGVPALSLNFLLGTLDPRITFTRGTNATLVDSTGKIVYAPANLLTFSEQFDNAAWAKTNSAISSNATLAPDGALTADKLTEAATTSVHRVSQNFPTTAVSHTFSVYVKASERTFALLFHDQSATGVAVDLSNGAISVPAGIGAPLASSSVSVGNGWYRCSITVAATAASNLFAVYPMLNATTFSYLGVVGSGIFVWGAQLEPVTYQTTPSAYVATVASSYYAPRFDYDPVTLAPKGILIEEQRVNILLQSNTFTTTWANVSGCALTASATTAPDGTAFGWKLNETAGSNSFQITQTVAPGVGNYTFTVFAKAGERSFLRMNLFNGVNRNVWFNLATGTVGTQQAGATGTITNYGNGWYRCSVSTTGGAPILSVIAIANADNSVTYTGLANTGIFIYGAQLETGSFATSYIPTVASQVTRSADVATMTGTNFSSWYNATQGTFVAQFTPSTISGTRAVLDANDNTANESIRLQNVSADPFFTVTDGGVDQANIDAGTVAANTSYKMAAAYTLNDFAASIGGGSVGTDASGTLPTVNQLQIGNSAAGNRLNGHVRSIAYYNTRLLNHQLQTLTQ